MELIKDGANLAEIAQMLEAEVNEIAIAVAFWGGDAKARLNIGNWKAKQIRIVCDATSGACNPKALSDLRDKVGQHLYTNSRLHAKVYWTPQRVLVTSANASASGLSLEGAELAGNIEIGILTSSPEILAASKVWFEDLLKAKGTVEVDDEVLKLATKMWNARRIGRRPTIDTSTISSALKDGAALKDRNIVVYHYTDLNRDDVGTEQHNSLKEGWRNDQIKPPVLVGEAVKFTCIDSYQESPSSLGNYPWSSWVIDLTDPQLIFWYVPDKGQIIPLKNGTVSIPLYGAERIPLGGGYVSLTKKDLAELKRRWKSKLGSRRDGCVSLADLAD